MLVPCDRTYAVEKLLEVGSTRTPCDNEPTLGGPTRLNDPRSIGREEWSKKGGPDVL